MPHRGVSPRMPDGVGQDLRTRLFRHIYSYTKAKNASRIAKCWVPLDLFMKRFYRCQKTEARELAGDDYDLHAAFHSLKAAYKDYRCRQLSGQSNEFWDLLYSLLEVATYYVQRLTQRGLYICDAIVRRVGKQFYPI